ncbi:unnamed protein product, partial [Symbiodinium pilosum]
WRGRGPVRELRPHHGHACPRCNGHAQELPGNRFPFLLPEHLRFDEHPTQARF